jgi:lipoprotein-releasing system ATP-binding protein
MSNLLETVDLHKAFRVGAETLWVLKGVSIAVARGEILAVLGASGAGKSTLLHILGALDSPTKGEVLLEGKSISALSERESARLRNETFGFVFQFYHLLPELTALENVMLPTMVSLSVREWRRKKESFRERTTDLLGKVGLADRLRHRPSQLSGGERQRVAIARALVNSPDILLCDEPTGNLDSASGKGIRELLWNLRTEEGLTIVLVTHDERLAAEADRIELITDGSITDGDVQRVA